MKYDSAFEENLLFLLSEKKFNKVLEVLQCSENDNLIVENVWNLINLVCLTVKTNSLLKNDNDVTSCKKVLLFLVSRGNPKEVLVSLLEQADSFKDNEFFCLLLEPLQLILKKTPGKRGKSLQWVLSTLNAHIETLSTPQNLDLQGDEKLLLDADPAVQETTYVLSYYFKFVHFFVDEVSFENLKKKEIHYFDRICNQQEIMHRYILKLFYHPLLFHDLHVVSPTRPKSSIRIICEGFVNCLSKICCNVFNLFKYDCSLCKDRDNISEVDEDDSVPLLALSNLSYLIFVEKIALSFQPLVYSHIFVFMSNLKYIIPLLKCKENLILFKGLHLSQTLVNQLDFGIVNYDCMELDVFTDFPRLLLTTAIYSQIEEHRNLAIIIFTTYLNKCNCKGRYYLMLQVMSTIKHSGAKGLVINYFKDNLHDALNGGCAAKYFLGKNLISFLKMVFFLSEGVETDILECSDKIMSSLNLLRYLLLRDSKKTNITGVWNLVNDISEKYLSPLSLGLNMCRAHYKQAMKDTESVNKIQNSLNTTVTVNNLVLPNVPLHFQKDIFRKALVTFDVIESILCRVKELISNE